MADLHKISGTADQKRVADVVFVHGLDGNARTTWHPAGRPDDFWPSWLGDDLPNLGIWALDYEASASAWKGHSMPLVDRASNAIELFDLDEIGQRPLAFVCHSLGGLLIKQVLRLAWESNKPEQHAIADYTRLVVFLSTPHSGADMASWINYLGSLLRTTVSVEELEAHHPRLLELNRWYRNQIGNLGIETFVYCEKVTTAGLLVVNQTTADPGIPNVDVVPLDENHITICKPASRQAIVYRRVKRLLEKMSADAPATTVAPAVLPEGEPRFSGSHKYAFCEQLGQQSWPKLASVLEIPLSDQDRFPPGDQSRALWEWLEIRGRLSELPPALMQIDRGDLARRFFSEP